MDWYDFCYRKFRRGPGPKREIYDIIHRLNSRYVGERLDAERQLKEMGPRAVDLLLDLIVEQVEKSRKRRRLYFYIAGCYTAVAIPAIVAAIILSTKAYHEGNTNAIGGYLGGILGGVLGGGGGGILGGFSFLLAPLPQQQLAFQALTKLNDVRIVGPLALALKSWDPHLRASAGVQLMSLLPQLQAEYAELLNSEQRKALYSVLDMSHAEKERDLVLAVLDVLERIGDANALPYVKRLANVNTSTEDEKLVQEKAKECLPLLEARIERLRVGAFLVRPATSPGDPSQTLVRPAQGVTNTEASILVRPSSHPE